MKKMIKNRWILPVLALLMVSCYEDKGNYDYRNIYEAVIEIPEAEEGSGPLIYDQFQNITITPVISNSTGDDDVSDDYDYSWELIVMGETEDYTPKKEIDDRMVLSYELADAPGIYTVVLTATHKATQAVSFYTFAMEVATTNGWLVLQDEGNDEGDISIIRDGQIIPGLNQGKHGISHNLFSGTTGEKIQKPRFMGWRADYLNKSSYNRIFIFTEDGFYSLNEKTYELISDDYSTIFAIQPDGFKPMGHAYNGPAYGELETLLNNGNIYSIRWNGMGVNGQFGTPYTKDNIIQTFEPFFAPIPLQSYNAHGVLYNKVDYPEGAFVVIGPFQNSYFTPTLPAATFNPNAIGANFDLQYLGTCNNQETGAIFKNTDDGDKPYLFHADFFDTASPVVMGKYDLSALAGITAATDFYFSIRGRVLYYVSGDKVYSWVFGSAADSVKEVLTLDNGASVTTMKNYYNIDNEDYHGKLLFIATYGAGGGKVYKVPINELTGVVNGTVETYDGFGRVVDMMLKL